MTKSRRGSFWYVIPDFGEIEFVPSVLAHFEKHQQKRRWHKEAGGQLFWEYTPSGHKRVGAITGPRRTDQRTRTSYKADHIKEQIEIDEYYEQGLYLLGDWHTHPEPIATPSREDREAIQEIYMSSINPGPGFILVIAGTHPLHKCLSVSWCNGQIMPVERLTKNE